jgi:hypothetical protein
MLLCNAMIDTEKLWQQKITSGSLASLEQSLAISSWMMDSMLALPKPKSFKFRSRKRLCSFQYWGRFYESFSGQNLRTKLSIIYKFVNIGYVAFWCF